MRIRLIAPKHLSYIGTKDVYSQQKLTLTYLAAITPSEHEVEIFDEDVSEIKYDSDADLVGISFNSANSFGAYEIAKKYRDLGVPVVFGGFHTSLFPEKAGEHADTIVIGEAEHVWEDLLLDLKNNELKKVYKSDKLCDLKNLPIPRYDLYKQGNFYNQYPLFISRGCPYNCTYCCIKSVYGSSYRKRPIEEIVKQIEVMKKKYNSPGPVPLMFCFIDDNIWGDVKYAKELFKALSPLNISWFAQGASLNISDELLDLASKSGCRLAFVGLESLYKENLSYLKKHQNDLKKYKDYIKKLHDYNIVVGGYFMVGLPYDQESLFEELAEFIEETMIELPTVMIYTPIPGTQEYNDSKWEDKDKYTNFKLIADALPIYLPANMTKKSFRQKYLNFMRKIFSDESIEIRLKNCRNIGFRHMNKAHQKYYESPEWDAWV